MYPLEKQAVENIMIRSYMKLFPDLQNQKSGQFLTSLDIDKLSDNVAKKLDLQI